MVSFLTAEGHLSDYSAAGQVGPVVGDQFDQGVLAAEETDNVRASGNPYLGFIPAYNKMAVMVYLEQFGMHRAVVKVIPQ
mgnify:CR=1 FL=1